MPGNESERSTPIQPALGRAHADRSGRHAGRRSGRSSTWDAVTAPDLDGYHVERFAADVGTWTRLTNDPLTDSAWTDTDVVNDTSYTYRVIARDGRREAVGPQRHRRRHPGRHHRTARANRALRHRRRR